MGRCYEFGVSIDPSSELAMVVAPEGGHCVCPSTGATCRGRFAGCTEIISQPGRIPPNAPEWSLGAGQGQLQAQPASQPVFVQTMPSQTVPSQTVPSQTVPAEAPPPVAQHTPAPAGGFHGALAAAEDRSVVRNNDTALADMRATLEALTDEVAKLRNRPQSATIEDLAEAVVILRNEAVSDNGAEEFLALGDQVDALTAHQHTLSALPAQMSSLEQGLQQLTSAIATIGYSQIDPSTIEEPMQKLARAVLELRSSQTHALGELRAAQTANVGSLEGLRNEVREVAARQARESHALRQQFTEMLTRIEERRGADVSGDELAAALKQMQSDLAKLQPDATEMVTATQLADTINTLRDAGVEDISAAHLVHAIQGDLRTIRDEMQSVKGRVEAMSGNGHRAVASNSPQHV